MHEREEVLHRKYKLVESDATNGADRGRGING